MRRLDFPTGAILDGLYTYDTRSNLWTLLSPKFGTSPPPRALCALTAANDEIYLFGGYTNSGGGKLYERCFLSC